MTIRQILDVSKNREYVSVIVHLNVLNRPVVQIKTRTSRELQPKKDVTANDDSGMMRFSIWGDENIGKVDESATYEITNACINEYPEGVLSLSTCAATSISKVNQIVEPTIALPQLRVFEASFPIQSVVALHKKIICPSCKKDRDDDTAGKIFKCTSCGNMTIKCKLAHTFVARLMFPKEGSNFSVTVFGSEMTDYMRRRCNVTPENVDEMAICLLQDEHSKVLYDANNVCIGMK